MLIDRYLGGVVVLDQDRSAGPAAQSSCSDRRRCRGGGVGRHRLVDSPQEEGNIAD